MGSYLFLLWGLTEGAPYFAPSMLNSFFMAFLFSTIVIAVLALSAPVVLDYEMKLRNWDAFNPRSMVYMHEIEPVRRKEKESGFEGKLCD
ncbi:MAG: hypothetical protein JW727_02330 [Candidatus Aenigmarchaeota archaeon]|nr:hypothetical protein [Candidatus Aenigmarchaeota archaeon]